MNFGIGYALLIISYIPLIFIRRKSLIRIFFVWMIFSLGFLAYLTFPYPQFFSDSIRFNYILDMGRSMGNFEGAYQWIVSVSSYAGQKILSLYLSFFTIFDTNGWLRGGTIAIFTSLLINIVSLVTKKKGLDSISYGFPILIFLLCFNLYFEIEGIRNFLSFAILSNMAVRMFIDDRKKSIIPGIIAAYIAIEIHPAVIIPMVFVWAYFILQGKFSKLIHGTALLTGSLFSIIITILQHFNSIEIVQWILRKASSYLSVGDNYNAFATTKEIQLTTFLLMLVILTEITYLYSSRKLPKVYNDLTITITLLCIGSFSSVQVYLRLIVLTLMLILPQLSCIITEMIEGYKQNKKVKIINLLWIIIIVCGSLLMFLGWYQFRYYKIGI
ncbi:hypothetical protein ABQD61_11875 [Enterococcus asini]|uniref:hypothetical protein n=1 Tax=Enterococcus asini TaxID=57732 RepID=UPI0032E3D481